MGELKRNLPVIRCVSHVLNAHGETRIDVNWFYDIDSVRVVMPDGHKQAEIRFEMMEQGGSFMTDYVPVEVFNSFTAFNIPKPVFSHDRLTIWIKDLTKRPDIYDDENKMISVYIVGK